METVLGIPSDELLETAYNIGKNGFLIDTLTRADLVYCMYHAYNTVELEHDTSALDKEQIFNILLETFITISYRIHDGKYYNAMRDEILSYYSEKPVLKEHISEAFAAFEAKMYYASLIAALPFIENLICSDSNSTSVLKTYSKKVSSSQVDLDFEVELQSVNIKGFLDSVFESTPFSSVEPNSINRHWFAHGRSNHTVREIDCYRVFSTIKNLIELLHSLPSSQSVD